jgi:L-cysteine S-thiosulfotransferase
MSLRSRLIATAVVIAVASVQVSVIAQTANDSVKEIERYRQMLADGNPAELLVARGEALWAQKRGPKNASMEQCDLGRGPGVVQAAYVGLPRYFADTNKVMDIEQRLLHCAMTLQGFSRDELVKQPFGNGPDKKSDMESYVAFIADASRGEKMNVAMTHAKEREAYALGQTMFFHRGGPYDFSCASCHSSDNQRIRLQDLPNLLKKDTAQKAYTSWPAYRVSQGELRTMQHRLWDCYRQQRFPEPLYASDAITALTLFLAANANGGEFTAPGLKR